MIEDAVEHRNVVGGEMAGSEDEQICNAAERPLAAVVGTVRQRVFKLAKERIWCAHRYSARTGEFANVKSTPLELDVDI